MNELFSGATSFNQDMSEWDVSQVTDMQKLFSGATSFNQDLSKWDVSQVTATYGMFLAATAFNQDLSKWDVSQVKYMPKMFYRARSFDQDLSKWNVSRVTNMKGMFQGATSFNRMLCGVTWVHSKAQQDDMFKDSPGSICSPSTISVTNNIPTDPGPPLSLTNSNVTIIPVIIEDPAAPPYSSFIIVGTAFAILAVIVTVVIVLVVMQLKKSTVSHISSQSETDSITLVARTPNAIP